VSTASALEITLNSKILWMVSQVSQSRIGTGRHGGRPSQEPEANPAAYRTTRRSSLSRAHRKKKSAPLREITVPVKPPPTQDCPENLGVKPVATKKVHRHLLGKYYSAPNVPAILLGRVDLRVDRQKFRNNIKNPIFYGRLVRLAIPVAVPDDTEVIPPKSQKRIPQRTGRHGGHPSQMPAEPKPS
jgi:hypothetical protein